MLLLGGGGSWSPCGASSVWIDPGKPGGPTAGRLERDPRTGSSCASAITCLWGEGDHQAEIEDLKREKVAMAGAKGLRVLELLRTRSLRWQLYVMAVLLPTLQLCGINAVESRLSRSPAYACARGGKGPAEATLRVLPRAAAWAEQGAGLGAPQLRPSMCNL